MTQPSLRLAAGLAALLLPLSGFAATCTTSPCQATMNVTAQVIAACTSLTAADIDFGSAIAPTTTTTTTTTANIVANCSSGTTYTVELDYGVNTAGTTQRRVNDGGQNYLDYIIYQPTATGAGATTTPWGTNANMANSAYTATGNGANQTLTATGVLTRVSGSPVGTYSDLVTVTLSY